MIKVSGVALAGVVGCAASASDLISNGSFESGPSQGCGWICVAAGSNELPGWSVVLNTIDRQYTSPPSCMPETWVAYDGNHSIDLNGCSVGGAIEQTIALEAGATYRLSFALTVNAYGTDEPGTVRRLELSIGQSKFEFGVTPTSDAIQPWLLHDVPFTAPSRLVTIRFKSLNNEHPNFWNGPVIDAVSLTETCPADVIENGVVDAIDLSAVLSSWGTDGGKYPRADVDANGAVDAIDLAMVLASWGACP